MQTKSEQANAYVFFSAITYRARPINFPPFQVWRSCKSEYVCVLPLSPRAQCIDRNEKFQNNKL